MQPAGSYETLTVLSRLVVAHANIESKTGLCVSDVQQTRSEKSIEAPKANRTSNQEHPKQPMTAFAGCRVAISEPVPRTADPAIEVRVPKFCGINLTDGLNRRGI